MRQSPLFVLAIAFAVTACAITPQIDLAKYIPVVDIPEEKRADFYADLEHCRSLGRQAQVRYKALREGELGESIAATAIGALLGAGVGGVVGKDSGTTGAGAVAGALAGASAASGNIHHTRDFAKLGPTIIVDRCMAGRGYTLLNAAGFGGG